MTRFEPNRLGRALRLAALMLVGCAALPPGPAVAAAENPTGDLRSALNDLRQGGYVIYMRHAITEQVGVTDEAADLTRCETQRQLSAEGRAQAVAIGKAVKALRIPIGLVQTSPFCRTVESAQLAFGTYTISTDLSFVMNANAAESLRLGKALAGLLSSVPRKGTNTVLVSHSANLREAAGIFAKPEGAAYVFRPLGDGRFEAVAKILPDEWSAVAQGTRGGKRP